MITALAVLSWLVLASAWAYAQGRSTASGLLDVWWHLLLGVVLLTQPIALLASGWLQVLALLPLAVAGIAGWPMALRVARRVAAHQVETEKRPHPTPPDVARERARGVELDRNARDTLEVLHHYRSAS